MRRIPLPVALACAVAALAGPAARAEVSPQAVVALIDTGINPYSPAFRDDSPQAYQHPSTYIPGYPAGAEALELDLTAPTLEQALENDYFDWELLASNALYWVPGTKIVGLISFGSGGSNCPNVPEVPPASNANGLFCRNRTILDDAGHGTMTASRATGLGAGEGGAAIARSLGAAARVVMIEGTGAPSVAWAAAQPWIDVQSNSWGSVVPAPPGNEISEAFKTAAERQMVMVASGNGLAFSGLAPTPTQTQPTLPQGVVIVGAHDNGHVSAWSGAPAHVVADGYGGYAADYDSLEAMAPRPISCCTSAAAPYAAGGASAIAIEARRILGDPGAGVRDGVVATASGGAILPAAGPLADGVFTLAEWRGVYLATAEARPREGRDDGLLHFTGSGGAPQHPEHGTGENPFCQFCWTLPQTWEEYDGPVAPHELIGYGAVNERSVALAGRVLRGEEPLPPRPAEDDFYARDQEQRRTIFGP